MFFGSRSKRFFCSAKALINQSSAFLNSFPTSPDTVMEWYDESLEYLVFPGFQGSTFLRFSRGQIFVQPTFDLLKHEFAEIRSSPPQYFCLNNVCAQDGGELFDCLVFSLPAQGSLHLWVSSLLVQLLPLFGLCIFVRALSCNCKRSLQGSDTYRVEACGLFM